MACILVNSKVIGYSLEAPTTPNHIELLNVDIIGDLDKLNETFSKYCISSCKTFL